MKPLASTPLWVRASRSVVRRLPAGRYRAMNALVGGLRRLGWGRRPFWTSTPTGTPGFRFVCDLGDAIAREVCYTGCYEAVETALVRALLEPGATFVDVGANWGYFSLLAAALIGTQGRVISIEPDPRLFALLQANLGENGRANSYPVPRAAAAGAGTLSLAGFAEDQDNRGLSRLSERVVQGVPSFEVQTDTVDAILLELHSGPVDLLKMDIEGAEDLALQGMADGLARGRYRRILLELHPTLLAEKGRSVADALRPLHAAAYRGWWIDHSPAATRRAAYSGSVRAVEFLRPVAEHDHLDAWPHMLWLAPGQELPADE